MKRRHLALIMMVAALLEWPVPAVPPGFTIEGSGGRTIRSDPRSNTVRVLSLRSGPDKKGIIAKLDPVVPQILVEAVILEIPADSSTNLYSALTQPSLPAEGAFDFNWCINFRTARTITVIPGGTPIRPQSPRNEFSILGSLSRGLNTMVSMMATNSTVKILQRPRIQTSDGVLVYFSIGHSQRFPVGSLGSSYCGPYYSVQSSETRVGLTVTCSITTNGSFLMDLVQEAEVPAGGVTIHVVGDAPVTTSNKQRASVTLGSSETLLLGGCITAIKTPVLSRLAALDKIPTVGDYLNRLITYPKRKTYVERIILIQPTVLPITKASSDGSTPASPDQIARELPSKSKRLLRWFPLFGFADSPILSHETVFDRPWMNRIRRMTYRRQIRFQTDRHLATTNSTVSLRKPTDRQRLGTRAS